MQFSLWALMNKILSQAQTARQNLFWHSSVWIWQPIWKWLSEHPHPKLNYHCICCDEACDEQADTTVLLLWLLPPLLYPQAVALHAVRLVITLKLLDPCHVSTSSKCWSLAETEAEGAVAVTDPPVSLQEQKKKGSNDNSVTMSVIVTHRICSVVSITLNSSWMFLPIASLVPWPVKELALSLSLSSFSLLS